MIAFASEVLTVASSTVATVFTPAKYDQVGGSRARMVRCTVFANPIAYVITPSDIIPDIPDFIGLQASPGTTFEIEDFDNLTTTKFVSPDDSTAYVYVEYFN